MAAAALAKSAPVSAVAGIKGPGSPEATMLAEGSPVTTESASVSCEHRGEKFDLRDGAVVIAAITSCTNTSNRA